VEDTETKYRAHLATWLNDDGFKTILEDQSAEDQPDAGASSVCLKAIQAARESGNPALAGRILEEVNAAKASGDWSNAHRLAAQSLELEAGREAIN
jgi:hypothetical protein